MNKIALYIRLSLEDAEVACSNHVVSTIKNRLNKGFKRFFSIYEIQ